MPHAGIRKTFLYLLCSKTEVMQVLGASENVVHRHLLAFKLGRDSKVNPSSPKTGTVQSVSALAQTSEISKIS